MTFRDQLKNGRVAVVAVALAAGLLTCIAASRTQGAVHDVVADAVHRTAPSAVIDIIRDAPFEGWQEVVVGTQVFYASNDGSYLLNGSVIDAGTGVDVTSAVVEQQVAGVLSKVQEKDTIRYTPETNIDGKVYVFTDPTCGFCQKFHGEVPALVAAGIEVVYLGFPREGLNGQVYQDLSAAFCSSDKTAAMDAMFAGAQVTAEPCLSPVGQHFSIASLINVSGTPAIFSADGRQLGGYLSADQLKTKLFTGN